MRRAGLIALCFIAAATLSLLAQSGGQSTAVGSPTQSQNQAQPTVPPKSTALILGQVVDGTTGQPIADAMVTLATSGRALGAGGLGAVPGASPQAQQAMQAAAAMAAQAGGRSADGPQRVMTGADGRFVFHDLPPGQYLLNASLTGYVASLGVPSGLSSSSNLMALGSLMAASQTGQPTSLALKEGEFATNLKLRLWKQAVVSGTVLDDTGQPAIGVTVQVVRRVMMAGRARYVPGSSAKTDDRGFYRIPQLVPGNYLVVVPQTQVSIPAAILGGVVDAITGGGAGGASGGGSAGAGWALIDMLSSGIDLTSGMNNGVRIGDYMVATSGLSPIVGPDGHLQMSQTMFFPGATAPTQASVLSLASGEERDNLNFQLQLVSTFRITGTATGPDGPVANLGVKLVVPGDGVVSDTDIDVASTMSRVDGSFLFFGVPPGQYLLRAVKQPRPALPAEAMSDPTLAAMFGGGGKGTTETIFASMPVTVSNDIDGLVLQLANGFRVSGRVEFESGSGKQPPPAAQMQGISVSLTSLTGGSPMAMLGDLLNGPDRVNAQGEFKTKGYAPGKYALSVTGTAGWQVKSAVVGGRDVLDAPLEIASADVSGVVVTFTDKVARLSGKVSATGETDLSEVSVIIFPSDYRAWISNGMSARLCKTARAARDGAYTITGVPAGEYLVAAIDRSSEGDMQDPAFVAALAKIASHVTIAADPVTHDVTKGQVVVR